MEDSLTNIQMPIFHLDIINRRRAILWEFATNHYARVSARAPNKCWFGAIDNVKSGAIQGQQGLGALIRDLGGFSNFKVSFSRPGDFRTINKSVLVD